MRAQVGSLSLAPNIRIFVSKRRLREDRTVQLPEDRHPWNPEP